MINKTTKTENVFYSLVLCIYRDTTATSRYRMVEQISRCLKCEFIVFHIFMEDEARSEWAGYIANLS